MALRLSFAHSDGIFFPINSNSPNDYKALLPYTIRDSLLVASMKQPAALIQSHSAPMALISAQKICLNIIEMEYLLL